MKFNRQKINEIKKKLQNIKEKITNNSIEKVPKRYYALLMLMLMLGIITLTNNIKQYNKTKQESFDEYKLEDQQVVKNNVEIINYQTNQSSISTDVSTIEEETIEVMSDNKEQIYVMPIIGEIVKEFAVDKLVYSETLGMWKTHPGVDIKAKLGENVKSACNGKVQEVIKDSFYGNVVKVLDNKGYIFVYGNLDSNINVRKGEEIILGHIIGTVGVSAAGELQDETHLHFEVIKDNIQVNPLDLIN